MSYEFKRDDVFGIASAIGGKTTVKGHELFFEICPYCKGGDNRDKNTFSINLGTGAFKCFRSSCGKQGHLVQMARDFDYPLIFSGRHSKQYRDLPQRPVRSTEQAIRYMQKRGISREITERFKITTQTRNKNILVFPFYNPDGVLKFVKYRKTDYDPKRDKNKEWCEAGAMPILFGMDKCIGFDRLIITEGQIDSLSLAEAGIENAVSVPTGALGFTWLEHCWEWIIKYAEIIIFGDLENGKVTLVDELSRRLPKPVKVVRTEDYLGEKDANAILQKYGKDALIDAVQNARLIPVTHIKELADVKSVDLAKLPKIRTGITNLDKILGGLYYGQVILLTGKRGEGKSTLMSQIIAEALNQSIHVLAYSGELADYHFKRWLDMQIAGPNHIQTGYNMFSDPVYSIDESTIDKINSWYRGKAYIYDNNSLDDSSEYDQLLTTIEQGICRYGIQLVCIDNLMTAIDATSTEKQYLQQSQFVRSLKQIAVRHNVVILLVAHPKKTAGNIDDNDNIYGSGDITNRADAVISYIKNKSDEKAGGKVLILKNRMTGKLTSPDDAITVSYDDKSKRIYASSGRCDYSYKWEKGTTPDCGFNDLPF